MASKLDRIQKRLEKKRQEFQKESHGNGLMKFVIQFKYTHTYQQIALLFDSLYSEFICSQ